MYVTQQMITNARCGTMFGAIVDEYDPVPAALCGGFDLITLLRDRRFSIRVRSDAAGAFAPTAVQAVGLEMFADRLRALLAGDCCATWRTWAEAWVNGEQRDAAAAKSAQDAEEQYRPQPLTDGHRLHKDMPATTDAAWSAAAWMKCPAWQLVNASCSDDAAWEQALSRIAEQIERDEERR